MNELYVSDCWIYFKTEAKTHDEAMNEFLKKCADAGIDINISNAELRDENGEEIEEQIKFVFDMEVNANEN